MKKWSIIKGILSLIIAAVITALTAIIPIVASVGKAVYANNVAVIFIGMELGPATGIVYTILSSFILNNIGMGSGVLLYVLLFQIVEAGLLGLLWHKKRMQMGRYLLTVIGGTFLLKPLSYMLFYIFNSSILGDMTFLEYMKSNYLLYLQNGWTDTLIIYATGIIIAYILQYILDMIFEKMEKRRKTNEKEGINCSAHRADSY